jgi:hypothetical protein
VTRQLDYPERSVLAVLDDSAAAESASAQLRAAGFGDRAVERLVGPAAAARIDATGDRSALARLRRIVQFSLMDQMPAMAWYEAALRDGRIVLAVRTTDRTATLAAVAALEAAGGHFINRFGRLATEEFVRWRGPEPAVPSVLR